MGIRTGRHYLESIQDGRRIYLNGERVENVVTHPAFRGITATVASLFDIAADPANDMIYIAPETGRPANKVFMIPRSREDLAERRKALTTWSRRTNGLVGRGPDHVGSFFAGFASDPGFFDRGGQRFGRNVLNFYKRMLDDSLYLSYVIVPPQVDRSKTAQGLEEPFLQVGVVQERDDGIVVRGAQMLGTAAAISDFLYVSCIQPLKPGDEDYALAFVLPMNTKGLKIYCRPAYAPGKPSTYDYPLSSQFDESDGFAVFDDVFIPWEHVFVHRDIDLCRGQFFELPSHSLGNHQANVRLSVKLKFLVGLARKVAATTRIDVIPGVQEKLSEVASLASLVEGMTLASETACVIDKNGVARPNSRFLYSTIALQAELYPRALQIVRELVGGGPLFVPSSYKELVNPETAGDVKRYVRSTGVAAEERIKLFKLVWDVIGSEFAGRHLQYEMFYIGAPHVAKGYMWRGYGFEEAVALVESFMGTYGLEAEELRVGAEVE